MCCLCGSQRELGLPVLSEKISCEPIHAGKAGILWSSRRLFGCRWEEIRWIQWVQQNVSKNHRRNGLDPRPEFVIRNVKIWDPVGVWVTDRFAYIEVVRLHGRAQGAEDWCVVDSTDSSTGVSTDQTVAESPFLEPPDNSNQKSFPSSVKSCNISEFNWKYGQIWLLS